MVLLESDQRALDALYHKVLDNFVSNHEYAQALALIDAGLAGSLVAPDYLLLALAEKHPKSSARLLVRLRDRQVRDRRPHGGQSAHVPPSPP